MRIGSNRFVPRSDGGLETKNVGNDSNVRSHATKERRRTSVMEAINLAAKLAAFSEHFKPRTVGQFNGHDLMVVKVKGPFTWHKHDDTDDFFLVLKGRMTIQMREGNVVLGPGEIFVVPRGVEHCPVADEEAHVLLIEPTGTPNTGDRATAAARTVI
jgi:mannose-6-phosphate isomerase-like protein (cupin superfamily)